MTTLRRARRDELPLLNARWAAVSFVASDEGDVVVVAEDEGGAVVGSGRLVPLRSQQHAFELGGMLVDSSQRGRGLGKRIVARLVDEAGDAVLWCIPFNDVKDLYVGFGFVDVDEAGAPPEIVQKLAFCRRTYPQPVVLLRR